MGLELVRAGFPLQMVSNLPGTFPLPQPLPGLRRWRWVGGAPAGVLSAPKSAKEERPVVSLEFPANLVGSGPAQRDGAGARVGYPV